MQTYMRTYIYIYTYILPIKWPCRNISPIWAHRCRHICVLACTYIHTYFLSSDPAVIYRPSRLKDADLHVYIYKYVYIYTCVHKYICVHIHIYRCVHIHTGHAYQVILPQYIAHLSSQMQTYMRTYIYIHTYILPIQWSCRNISPVWTQRCRLICVHISKYVYIYICVHICYIYRCVHIHTEHIYAYIYTCVYIYINMCTYTHRTYLSSDPAAIYRPSGLTATEVTPSRGPSSSP